MSSDEEPAQQIHPAMPPIYSVFPKRQKQWIVFLAAFAGWFSTMSSMIYFPAITALAESLNCSITQIDLTITSYLAVSAIAPAITGGLADASGRRPVFIVMLTIYVAANIGLALQRSYPVLLILRMVQSAGISGVFALAYGVVADIASPAERGGYVGVVSFCTNTAPALGPVIGALLLAFRGWASIFWFLATLSALCLGLIIFALPETARNVVGNGSLPAYGVHRLPFSKPGPGDVKAGIITPRTQKFPNPLACLTLLLDKQNAILIYTISILYTTLTCLQASLSSLFIKLYGFDNLQAGLIYLPFGVGSTSTAFLTGRLLDRDYSITAIANGFPVDKTRSMDSHLFPIAKARLRSLAYPVMTTVALIACYGWSLQVKSHVGIPLTLQFFIGASAQCCFTMLNTLLMDLNHKAPSTVQAACNVARCTFAALGTAVLQVAIDAVGVGYYFTIVASACVTTVPFLILLWKRSQGWRLAEFMVETISNSESSPLLR